MLVFLNSTTGHTPHMGVHFHERPTVNRYTPFVSQAGNGDMSFSMALKIEVPSPPSDSVSALAWSPTANILAAASWDNQVRIWEVRSTARSNVFQMFPVVLTQSVQVQSSQNSQSLSRDFYVCVVAHYSTVNLCINVLDVCAEMLFAGGRREEERTSKRCAYLVNIGRRFQKKLFRYSRELTFRKVTLH